MSTLAEITAAVEQLPVQEQRALVEQLSKPRVQPRILSRAEREEWMAELAEFRRATSTGCSSISVEQILDETREERI